MYNDVLQNFFISAVVAIAICSYKIGLFTCIRLNRRIPMPGFAFFPLIICDGLAMIFTIAASASLRLQIGFSTALLTFSRWLRKLMDIRERAYIVNLLILWNE
jgi:hypothetical protein